MSEATHVWVTLRDREGKDFLRVRIPRMVPPPPMLQWGARFYIRRGVDGAYCEGDCLFVTLESQYPQSKDEMLHASGGLAEWSR